MAFIGKHNFLCLVYKFPPSFPHSLLPSLLLFLSIFLSKGKDVDFVRCYLYLYGHDHVNLNLCSVGLEFSIAWSLCRKSSLQVWGAGHGEIKRWERSVSHQSLGRLDGQTWETALGPHGTAAGRPLDPALGVGEGVVSAPTLGHQR